MMKKFFCIFCLLLLVFPVFSENLRIKFLKGNISDKTNAVRQASGEESYWLSNTAIDFALANKEIIGSDKELDGLAVAAILSISNEFVKNSSDEQRQLISDKMTDLFNKFNDSVTVQIAVISKMLILRNELHIDSFTLLLNNYISTVSVNELDPSALKAIINALSYIGNSESFIILYNFWTNVKYEAFYPEIETSLVELIPVSVSETLKIVRNNPGDSSRILKLVEKNSKISKNSLCDIAENVLNGAILSVNDSSAPDSELIQTQLKALKILSENKWTKSSSVAVAYFEIAKDYYERSILPEERFADVILALSNVSPIDSVPSLILYLEELNGKKEQLSAVSNAVVLSVVKTLGAIGDKSAFDSLLAVTYLRYSEPILSAAREALSGLRW